MKLSSALSATLASVYLLTLPAIAQDEAKPAKPTQAEKLAQYLHRFPQSDANKDGTLTMEEARAHIAMRKSQDSGRPSGRIEPTHADYSYGEHEKQRFDIWLAESKDGKPTPLVIFIHGGGFRGGDKRGVNAGLINEFLEAGVSYASMNYRLTDVGPYPMPMHDSARGLQTIRSMAKEWNLDPNRIACHGGSAGAGISLWLGFHDDLADPESEDPIARQSTRIVAAATGGGQSTYNVHTYKEWFGVELQPHSAFAPLYAITEGEDENSERVIKLMNDASPITHLTKDDVPVYMTYSKGDVPVTSETDPGTWVHHVRLGLKLQEAMNELGMECVVVSPDHKDDPYGSVLAFFLDKLGVQSASAE